MNSCIRTICLLGAMALSGCATVPPDITSAESQLVSRQVQTREYATLDKSMTMRSVVATLQDLGFTIDQADAELGTITATRHHEYTMRMTVAVFEKSGERISVRANARIDEDPVTSAKTYQDFFVVLDKAMFLTMNNVD